MATFRVDYVTTCGERGTWHVNVETLKEAWYSKTEFAHIQEIRRRAAGEGSLSSLSRRL